MACIGGGSNSIGLFYPFLADEMVRTTGVEAGGKGDLLVQHAARFLSGSMGVFQGIKTYLLQDDNGQIEETSSIAAGLDYPGIGPESAYLREILRVEYSHVNDSEALAAARLASRLEGILPALESAHALAYLIKRAPEMRPKEIILIKMF